MNLKDKEVLKAVGKLLYIISGSDHNFHNEEFTVKTILMDSFGLTEGEVLDIKNEAYAKGKLIEVTIAAIDIINAEKNPLLESLVLGLVNSIALDDKNLTPNEEGILKVIKDRLHRA